MMGNDMLSAFIDKYKLRNMSIEYACDSETNVEFSIAIEGLIRLINDTIAPVHNTLGQEEKDNIPEDPKCTLSFEDIMGF